METHPYTVSPTEAAAYIGVHPETLRRWARSGRVRSMTTPGGWRRFSLTDLDAFLTENVTGGDAA